MSTDQKAKYLEPNEYGNFPCPYCHYILTPIVKEWMSVPEITDYICHHCQIGFKTKVNSLLDQFMTVIKSQSRMKNE